VLLLPFDTVVAAARRVMEVDQKDQAIPQQESNSTFRPINTKSPETYWSAPVTLVWLPILARWFRFATATWRF
jgi:hypothetical protein